jgi:phage portal protein BeeE
LEGVNEFMTGIELKYTIIAHLELAGNFYGLLDGARDENSQPKAIHPLNPGRVNIKIDQSQYPYRISSYEFTIDGKRYNFDPAQILHIKYPDPNDPYVGIGIPQTIPVWIDSDNFAMEYNMQPIGRSTRSS